MAVKTLEDRVAEIERAIDQLKSQLPAKPQPARWERIFGTFADSEGFEEAVRAGCEYRESLRPMDEEAPD